MSVDRYNFGKVHVYYGFGPGKSSALFGRIVRALGHGLKVGVFQFMKKHSEQDKGFFYGEYITLTRILNVDVFQYGRIGFLDIKKGPKPEDVELAIRGLREINEAIQQEKYNIIICDELLTAIQFKLLSVDDVIAMIKRLPKSIELMLSGHAAIPEIMELADYVTEVKKVKHPYDSGVQAREGIEF